MTESADIDSSVWNGFPCEECRAALADPRPIDILKGGPDVTLHVETFGYVSLKYKIVHLRY
jgi:hypothetical protein